MKQKFLIAGAFIILIVVLIGLNAASYVQKEKQPDSEQNPNRSTYNAGVTGTRAFYDLLAETGRKVVRWQEPPDALLNNKKAPKTFVITGDLKREITEPEKTKLLQWVADGGRLVVIDREPPENLQIPTENWRLNFKPESELIHFGIDPADTNQMIAKIDAAIPVQPTMFTKNVNSVQPSRFASTITFERFETKKEYGNGIGSGNMPSYPAPKPTQGYDDEDYFSEEQLKPTPTPKPPPVKAPKVFQTNTNPGQSNLLFQERRDFPPPPPPPPAKKVETSKDGVITTENKQLSENEIITAPVLHLANKNKNLLADIPHGAGNIIYLSDPFIVSNGGLRLADNVQLAINIVAANDGLIAFDEYHQGFGGNNNRLFQYFSGTPVIPIFLQILLLIGLIFFSQSRRFARPVPDPEPDRLSKLEYVSAMAELQQRTKAFDLALENIYHDFRRRVSRFFGVDNFTVTRKELANLIAERTKFDRNEVEEVLFKCEDIIHGERTNKKEVVQLASRLREFEEKLGLQRQKRQRKVV
ncbi:MAG: DUF4350 domain-containing protein [Pyrinomonadaceae bacterium]|nr:DUF4350 domain-containing protein [Pyrinomonadaceae bacterium]